MDDELLAWLYRRLLKDPTFARTCDCTYCDGLILLMQFYKVAHHQSGPWVCQLRHWPLGYRHLRLPRTSQFNKRLKASAIQAGIRDINDEIRQRLPLTGEHVADGKPLIVGGFSHDRDARVGKVPGGFARGYKLHLIVNATGVIEAFTVTALNAGEATVLRSLIACTHLHQATLRADANYDSNATYLAAAEAGGRLIAPRRKLHTGIGHHPQHPDRLAAIELLEQNPQALTEHKRHRNRVEQILAHLTNLPFGLRALPNFVRRLSRVRLWVMTKITLYHLHLSLLARHAVA